MKLKICDQCNKKVLAYVDATADLDRGLRLIADLMLTANPPCAGDADMSEVGHQISLYLTRVATTRAFFFDIKTGDSGDQALQAAQRAYLRAQLGLKK